VSPLLRRFLSFLPPFLPLGLRILPLLSVSISLRVVSCSVSPSSPSFSRLLLDQAAAVVAANRDVDLEAVASICRHPGPPTRDGLLRARETLMWRLEASAHELSVIMQERCVALAQVVLIDQRLDQLGESDGAESAVILAVVGSGSGVDRPGDNDSASGAEDSSEVDESGSEGEVDLDLSIGGKSL
jgi:hypothetical protein